MKEHHFLTQRTARYFTIGGESKEINTVWIACHGYAQLAAEFIMKLKPLAGDNTLIVAPEALSRFYTKGFFGAVGACWMTREDRESEIDDYVNYLHALYETIKSQVCSGAQFHLLGFSQGCSTLCRWVAKRAPAVSGLWLCCGNIPDDIDFEKFRSAIHAIPVHLIIGDEDTLIGEKDRHAVQQRINEHRLPVKTHVFKGGHDLNLILLKRLLPV